MKNLVQATFRRFGYTVHRTETLNGLMAPGAPETPPPAGPDLMRPWLEPWFQSVYQEVRDHTVVSADRCYALDRWARYAAHLPGDFAECGVYKGGTAFLIARALEEKRADKRLHLFDTFAGMPDTTKPETDGHATGDFGDTSLESVRALVAPYAARTAFHPGFIPETFSAVRDARFAFVHVDVDIYQTSHDCCAFFYERLVPGGVVLFDDYGFNYYAQAQRLAVDRFFADKPETLVVLPTGQCLFVKLPSSGGGDLA